jgi:hypothetical protein
MPGAFARGVGIAEPLGREDIEPDSGPVRVVSLFFDPRWETS